MRVVTKWLFLGVLQKIAYGYFMLVVHMPGLSEEADKARKASFYCLICWRTQICLHVCQRYVE